jgi:Tol biopolymer transport system component
MKPNKSKKGYLTVNIKQKTTLVHRLIAETFISNPENKPQVNHIDGDKTNNNINNLEWTTNEQNMKHSWKIGLRDNMYTKVIQYDLDGNFIKEWNNIKEIKTKLNIRHSSIWACCTGKYKTAGRLHMEI